MLKKVGDPDEIKNEDFTTLELKFNNHIDKYIDQPIYELKVYVSDPGHHISTLKFRSRRLLLLQRITI